MFRYRSFYIGEIQEFEPTIKGGKRKGHNYVLFKRCYKHPCLLLLHIKND